jgi:rubredoxin
MRPNIVCTSCGYRGPAAPRSWGDVLIGLGSLLTGGGPGIVEHWRDIFAGRTCPQCANPKGREEGAEGER